MNPEIYNNCVTNIQNGFQKSRSCEDHTFTLNSIIRNNKNTFTVFIDLRKCFEFVDRDLLLNKLLLNNVDGRVYNSIKNIYASSSACVCINNSGLLNYFVHTDWFDCTTRLKQGCKLSPTLRPVFANDLIHEINSLGLGIDVGSMMVSTLFYADAVVLISDSEINLQRMLDVVHEWCKRWRVLVNTNKSKCIHFRRGHTQRSEFIFSVGGNVL
jgi:hypothetical protein